MCCVLYEINTEIRSNVFVALFFDYPLVVIFYLPFLKITSSAAKFYNFMFRDVLN
jgi:hypothetical protein